MLCCVVLCMVCVVLPILCIFPTGKQSGASRSQTHASWWWKVQKAIGCPLYSIRITIVMISREDSDGVFMLLIIMILTPPTKVERSSCHILRNPSTAPPPRYPKTWDFHVKLFSLISTATIGTFLEQRYALKCGIFCFAWCMPHGAQLLWFYRSDPEWLSWH